MTPSPPGTGKSIVFIAEYVKKEVFGKFVTRTPAFRGVGEEGKRSLCRAFGRIESSMLSTEEEIKRRRKSLSAKSSPAGPRTGDESLKESQHEHSVVDRFQERSSKAQLGLPVGNAVQAE